MRGEPPRLVHGLNPTSSRLLLLLCLYENLKSERLPPTLWQRGKKNTHMRTKLMQSVED